LSIPPAQKDTSGVLQVFVQEAQQLNRFSAGFPELKNLKARDVLRRFWMGGRCFGFLAQHSPWRSA